MSRSYAHKPKISWVIYKSNKKDRTLANKIFRAKSKNRIRNGKEPLHSLRECSDVWNFNSDGLPHWRNKIDKSWLRK